MAAVFELSEYSISAPSPLQRAVHEIQAVALATRSPRGDSAARQVSDVDGLLDQLEQLHLRGYVRVPDSLVARIETFLGTLPIECRRVFPVRTRISRVIDELFEVQDSLLSIKVAGRQLLIAEETADP
ncbi:MAG TPA: hypothetical protein VGR61_05860 [Candidatus Dormibacteraeota bacterium]|nr:hypothetical protein [Candidatus Dormibacteraeota bacterium]